MRPEFRGGNNIAMKVPTREYARTVAFYRDILGLPEVGGPAEGTMESVGFDFGGKTLWIDRVTGISQAEIWLEVVTDDLPGASRHFEEHRCPRRDEIEPLPEGFKGFWLSSPANIIHLVAASENA